MLNRTQPPSPCPIPPVALAPPDSYTLNNELPVFVYKGGTQPLIRLALVARSGTWYAPAPGIAQFTAAMLKESTQQRSANEVASFIDQLGASVEVSVNQDFFTLQLTTLRQHLVPLLQLIQELLTQPLFREKDFQVVQQRQQQQLQLQLAKNDFLAAKELKSLLYGPQHPYGGTLTPEQIAAVTPEQLQHYHQHQLLAGAMVFVSGQVDDQLQQQLEAAFGDLVLPAGQKPLHTASPQQQKLQLAGPNKLQAALALGKPVCRPDHPDYIPLLITTTLLGGYFGSRLMQSLREDKGYTYGIYATLRLHAEAGHLWMAADVVQDKAQEACTAIAVELDKLASTPVAPKELETLASYLLGSLLRELEGPHHQLQQFKSRLLCGLPDNYHERLWEGIQAINAATIQRIAQTYLAPADFCQVVVGGLYASRMEMP